MKLSFRPWHLLYDDQARDMKWILSIFLSFARSANGSKQLSPILAFTKLWTSWQRIENQRQRDVTIYSYEHSNGVQTWHAKTPWSKKNNLFRFHEHPKIPFIYHGTLHSCVMVLSLLLLVRRGQQHFYYPALACLHQSCFNLICINCSASMKSFAHKYLCFWWKFSFSN